MDGTEIIVNDFALVQDVQDDNAKCNDSLSELITRHSALCFDIYKKYAPALTASGICVQEMYKEKNFIIYKSAKSFDPERKVKFSTWVGNQVRYQCLNAINGNHLFPVDDAQLDYYLEKDGGHQEEDFTNDIEFVFNILGQLKDKRIEKVFKLRYFGHPQNKKMPWSQVAKRIKTSTQTAINLHDRGRKILYQKMVTKTSNYLDSV